MTKRILLAGLVLLELSAIPAGAQQADDCSDKKGGWKTICLTKKHEQLDVLATNVYWSLQNRIQDLTRHGMSAPYVTQLRSLLKKNELDFINYSESFCNMQVVLSDVETELNKILSCSIHTSQLRIEEINRILEAIAKKEEGTK